MSIFCSVLATWKVNNNLAIIKSIKFPKAKKWVKSSASSYYYSNNENSQLELKLQLYMTGILIRVTIPVTKKFNKNTKIVNFKNLNIKAYATPI